MIIEKASEDIEPTTVDMDNVEIPLKKPRKYQEIKLAWSQYRNGKWSAKKLSDKVVKTEYNTSSPIPLEPDRWTLRPILRKSDGAGGGI